MLASLLLSVQEWAGFTLGSPVDAVTMLQSTGSLPSRSALPAGRSAATLRNAYHAPWWFSPRNGRIGQRGCPVECGRGDLTLHPVARTSTSSCRVDLIPPR